jgi:hypothetical protein
VTGALQPLPFAVGERAEYAVKFSGLSVGSGEIRVAGVDTLRGRTTWRLRYQIRGGVPFFRVNDSMESWYDPIARHALRFTQDLREGPKRYERFFEFFPERQVFEERGQEPKPSVAEPLDDASFLFFVRTVPLEVGQVHRYDRYFKRETNPVEIRVLRRERVRVPAGDFDAVVVQPVFKSRGIFSEGGQAELWISDDDRRVVVQLKSKLSFGSIQMFLRSYEPGA